jgi:hypothetical protein
MDSQQHAPPANASRPRPDSPPRPVSNGACVKDVERSKNDTSNKDTNHNTTTAAEATAGEAGEAEAEAEDAAMASEGDSDSMREFHQG